MPHVCVRRRWRAVHPCPAPPLSPPQPTPARPRGHTAACLQFHCQQLKCTRDKFGNVIDGSTNQIQRVFYFWGLQQEQQVSARQGRAGQEGSQAGQAGLQAAGAHTASLPCLCCRPPPLPASLLTFLQHSSHTKVHTGVGTHTWMKVTPNQLWSIPTCPLPPRPSPAPLLPQGVVTAEGKVLPPRWVIKDMMWQSMLALV